MKEKKKLVEFPKGFFQTPRENISLTDALINVKPFEWNDKINKTKNYITKKKIVIVRKIITILL